MVNPKLVYCKSFASHHLKVCRDVGHRWCSSIKRFWTEGRMMLFGEIQKTGHSKSVRSVRFVLFVCFTQKKETGSLVFPFTGTFWINFHKIIVHKNFQNTS